MLGIYLGEGLGKIHEKQWSRCFCYYKYFINLPFIFLGDKIFKPKTQDIELICIASPLKIQFYLLYRYFKILFRKYSRVFHSTSCAYIIARISSWISRRTVAVSERNLILVLPPSVATVKQTQIFRHNKPEGKISPLAAPSRWYFNI